jgi:hypothetical protein
MALVVVAVALMACLLVAVVALVFAVVVTLVVFVLARLQNHRRSTYRRNYGGLVAVMALAACLVALAACLVALAARLVALAACLVALAARLVALAAALVTVMGLGLASELVVAMIAVAASLSWYTWYRSQAGFPWCLEACAPPKLPAPPIARRH